MNKLVHTPLAESKIDFKHGRQFQVKNMKEFEAFAHFCKQKYDQSKEAVAPLNEQKVTKSEIEIMYLINKILKEQAGAPDINKELFQDKCVSEHGKDLNAYKNELNALKKNSILKVRRDSDQYTYYDINVEKFNQAYQGIERQKRFEEINTMLSN